MTTTQRIEKAENHLAAAGRIMEEAISVDFRLSVKKVATSLAISKEVKESLQEQCAKLQCDLSHLLSQYDELIASMAQEPLSGVEGVTVYSAVKGKEVGNG